MAKKSAKNPTADSTAITVLPNQIPTRFIAPVDKAEWVHIGENFWEIPVEQFTEHPENSLLFNSSWKDDSILENSIKINGILVPIIANLHSDGELRVVSGHRRLLCANNLEIKTVVTESRELTDLGKRLVKMHEEGAYQKDGTIDGIPYIFEVRNPKAESGEIELIAAVGALMKKLFKALGYGLVAYVIVAYFTVYRYWNASDPSDQLIIEYGSDDILYGQMLSAAIGFIVAGITLVRR